MKRKRTAHEVSVRGSSFDAVQRYCTEHKTGTKVATQVNLWIEERLDRLEAKGEYDYREMTF